MTPVETPIEGRGGCSRITVPPTAAGSSPGERGCLRWLGLCTQGRWPRRRSAGPGRRRCLSAALFHYHRTASRSPFGSLLTASALPFPLPCFGLAPLFLGLLLPTTSSLPFPQPFHRLLAALSAALSTTISLPFFGLAPPFLRLSLPFPLPSHCIIAALSAALSLPPRGPFHCLLTALCTALPLPFTASSLHFPQLFFDLLLHFHGLSSDLRCAFPRLFTTSYLPFFGLSLPFFAAFSLPPHCLSSALHCLSATFHCLLTAFHRPFTACPRPFAALSLPSGAGGPFDPGARAAGQVLNALSSARMEQPFSIASH